MRTLLKVAFALVALVLVAVAALIFLLWPASTTSNEVIIHWGTVPDEERAGVVAGMERERDVFRATFEQRGRDISLGLMVMHPMDIERGRAPSRDLRGQGERGGPALRGGAAGRGRRPPGPPAGVPVLGAGVLHE